MGEFNFTSDSTGNLVGFDENGQPFLYNLGDIAWVLASTALVWIMVPGLGFFYSGCIPRRHALSVIYLSLLTSGVTTVQWWFWGYSLTFGEGTSQYIGNLRHIFLRHVSWQPIAESRHIPIIVFCVYQLMFATTTAMIAVGALCERGRVGWPLIIFLFIWSTLVYNPVACWNWNSNGWSSIQGGLDWAGGTPVHITSGATAMAISYYLGPRAQFARANARTSSTSLIALGTVFLWFGWFGFNGGSSLSANLSGAQASMNTHVAASVGGLTWLIWDKYKDNGREWSVLSFCSGAIAGLVAITPGAGYVSLSSAVAFGVAAGLGCVSLTVVKDIRWIAFDDPLDIVAIHAGGGMIGVLMTGFLADKNITALDPRKAAIRGGWVNHEWIQLAWQCIDGLTGLFYSLVMTTIILWVLHFLRLPLRLPANKSEEIQRLGIDSVEHGEFVNDFVAADRDEPTLRMTHNGIQGIENVPGISPPPGAMADAYLMDILQNTGTYKPRIV